MWGKLVNKLNETDFQVTGIVGKTENES